MRPIPVINTAVLSGLPDFVRHELGDRALARAARESGIDLEAIAGQACFIPHQAVLRFFEGAARAAGDGTFGLRVASQMSVANYGIWGRYVLGGATLGTAIARGIGALPYHSSGDVLALTFDGDTARLGYVFALAGRPDYDQVAAGAAAALASLVRLYASPGWRPLRVELDIPRPRHAGAFEDAFRCRVSFGAPSLGVVFGRDLLEAPRVGTADAVPTLEDVARARSGSAPRDLRGVVAEQVRGQLFAGAVSVEATAQAMAIGVRSLQRELNRAGTDFRTIANEVRTSRAIELLRGTDASVTSISTELGYSAPAHFARALRKATGQAPRELRARR